MRQEEKDPGGVDERVAYLPAPESSTEWLMRNLCLVTWNKRKVWHV